MVFVELLGLFDSQTLGLRLKPFVKQLLVVCELEIDLEGSSSAFTVSIDSESRWR